MGWRALQLVLCILGFLGLSETACPCSIDEGKLTCLEDSITKFPEDLILQCNFNYSSIWGLIIENQPFTILKADAFLLFPELTQMSISSNEQLQTIEKDAFRGMTKVKSLLLVNNNLTLIEKGSLDALVNLDFLDMRHNLFLEAYNTTSWHFCVNAAEFELNEKAPTFYKSFIKSNQTEEYCNKKVDDLMDGCSRENGVIDCRAVEDLRYSPCQIRNENFSNILVDFPAGKTPVEPQDYYEGESNVYFEEFNSEQGSMEYAKYMSEITLYETKYDLTKLDSITSELTELVTIKADTVYMSGPMTINHKIDIRSRVVLLKYPITMNMTKDQFTDGEGLEAWAFNEEYFYIGKVLMSKKTFGLVSILQSEFKVPSVQTAEVCHPEVSVVEETGMDISDWYDITAINLHYVCASTIMNSQKNEELVDDICKFNLGFVYNDTLVDDQSTFIAAQKFSRLLELNSLQSMHNVPAYSISTISKLSEIMSRSMSQYKQNELQQETQLSLATGRAIDTKIQFESIRLQQQNYFSMEQAVLDSIWAATDTNWNFSFDHRKIIEGNINTLLNAIQDQMFQMEKNDLNRALQEAESSKIHIDAEIEGYEAQIGRFNYMASKSYEVQNMLLHKLENDTTELQRQMEVFEKDVHGYMTFKIVWSVYGLFRALEKLAFALITGEEFDPNGFHDDVWGIYDAVLDIFFLLLKVQDLQKTLSGLHIDDLAEINVNLSTTFKDSLQAATELKLMGPVFDDFERTVTVQIDAMNEATDFVIRSTEETMMAVLRVTDGLHQLSDESAYFAEIMLRLSEETDKLEVARKDKELTAQQIKDINKQLEDLKLEQDQFIADRDQARKEYEEQIEDMEAQYKEITTEMREEYKRNITQSFETFQSTFDILSLSYEKEISKLITSIHLKFYGLKEHSMNQRSMIMSLYQDYCDAEFYNSFTECSKKNLPYMSDDFESLITKLLHIQWDSVVSNEELPGTPEVFSGQFDINSTNHLIAGIPNYLVETIKNTSQIYVNLKELDEITGDRFPDFWRIRIESVKLILLDKDEKPVQSLGSSFGQEIQVRIRYPTIFNDTDINKNKHSFLAQNFQCNSDYVTNGLDVADIAWQSPLEIEDDIAWQSPLEIDYIEWRSPCVVGEEFSQQSYKPSPDGIFSFQIQNADQIDMDSVENLQIRFTGTRIGFT